MIVALEVAFGLVALLGAVSTALIRDSYGKVISLGILVAGIVPFVVDRGYLDVAVAVSLIAPVVTIFVLMVVRREQA
ncbi:MAG: energy-converting hydrogenase subunit [Methanoculleus sp.]|nr:energy-converting hydrogenase subunit [Methanoculleus sp.]